MNNEQALEIMKAPPFTALTVLLFLALVFGLGYLVKTAVENSREKAAISMEAALRSELDGSAAGQTQRSAS